MWLYFVLRALEAIGGVLRRLWSRGRFWRLAVIVICCWPVASIAGTGVEQLRLNEDPLYTSDSHRRILQTLLAARGPHGRLRWFGPLATFHPVHRANLKGDDYFDIFHIGRDSLEYFLNEAIVPANQIANLADCDAVLKAQDIYYRNQSIPAEGVPPPTIWTARVLGPSAEFEGGASRLQTPDGTLVVRLAAIQGHLALVSERDSGPWHVYLKLPDGTLRGGKIINLPAGQPRVLDAPDTLQTVGLLLMRMADNPGREAR
jgi:hypothetical protein